MSIKLNNWILRDKKWVRQLQLLKGQIRDKVTDSSSSSSLASKRAILWLTIARLTTRETSLTEWCSCKQASVRTVRLLSASRPLEESSNLRSQVLRAKMLHLLKIRAKLKVQTRNKQLNQLLSKNLKTTMPTTSALGEKGNPSTAVKRMATSDLPKPHFAKALKPF